MVLVLRVSKMSWVPHRFVRSGPQRDRHSQYSCPSTKKENWFYIILQAGCMVGDWLKFSKNTFHLVVIEPKSLMAIGIWLWITSNAPTVFERPCPTVLPICSGTSYLLHGSIPWKVYGERAQSVTYDLSHGRQVLWGCHKNAVGKFGNQNEKVSLSG